MICPKCGFDQPPDRYCASCGVDLQNYKGKQKSSFRPTPLIFLGIALALVVGTILYLDKLLNWDLGKFYPESEIIDTQTSANFGAASDLQLENGEQPTPTDGRLGAPTNLGGVQAPVATGKAETVSVDFKSAPVTFIIGEITEVEVNQLIVVKDTATEPDVVIGGVDNDIPLIRRFHTDRTVKLNMGENQIPIVEDYLIRFDIKVEITSAVKSVIKAKIRYDRMLAEYLGGNEHKTFEVSVGPQKTIYIIDRIPRAVEARPQVVATSSLLALLYKSSTFLAETSEVVHLLQFE